MFRIQIIFLLIFLASCTEKKNTISSKKNKIDTLYILEKMNGDIDFSYTFDSLNKDKFLPRNHWISVNVKGLGEMVKILKHADLYLESTDSNFIIRRLSNYDYKFYVRNSYVGYIPNSGPISGQEWLESYNSPHVLIG
jgi:hypothetical protein